MGDVSIIYQITPKDIDVDLGGIQKKIEELMPDNATIRGFQIKPVAFGLKILLMNVIVPDAGGVSDQIEEIIKGIEDVGNADVTDMTLI